MIVVEKGIHLDARLPKNGPQRSFGHLAVAKAGKHLAAVFYAIGNRLDTRPELLFLLRGVDQTELVAAATKESVSRAVRGNAAHALADHDLAGIFGIEIAGGEPPAPARPAGKPKPKPEPKRTKQRPKAKPAKRKPAKRSGRKPRPPVTE